MADNKYQIAVDFMLQFQSDPAKLNQIANETKKIAETINPDIKFDTDQFKKEVMDLSNSLENLNNVDLTGLNDAFDDFEKALSNLTDDELLQFENALKDGLENFDTNKAQKEIDEMTDAFVKSKKSTEDFISKNKLVLQAMEFNGKKGSEAYNKIEKEIIEAEKELKKFGVTADESGTKTKSIGEKLATFGLAAQGFQTLTSSIGELSQPFIQLDTATQTIKTLGDEAAEMAPRLRDAAIAMSKDLPFGASEIQSAMGDALASGVQGGEEGLKKFADTAAKLATGGGAELGAVVKGLGATLNAFGETSEATGKYADTMFNIVNAGVTTIDELNSNLSGVTPQASAMGLSFDKVGGSLALMTQKGIPTAQSVTKLNSLLVEMAKPSAGITEALNAAGVSLEDFHKMIADDDLIGAFGTLQKGFEITGKSATQSFSSTEASSAFNALTSNMDQLQESLDFVSNTTGSTDNAFKLMSESIDVQTKQMKASMESTFISIIGSMGSAGPAFVTLSQQLSTFAPQISALSGLAAIVPDGLIDNIGKMGIALVQKLVPGLITTATSQAGVALATEGATAAQYKFNAAALLNPYILSIAVIAGAVIAIRELSDALHESAVEKLEDAKAEQSLLDKQIEVTKNQRDMKVSSQSLAEQFKKEGESAMKNNELMRQLATAYPGVIDATKSYEENLSSLEKASKKTQNELYKLDSQLSDLSTKRIELGIELQRLETNAIKENMEDALTEALIDDTTWMFPAQKAWEHVSEYIFNTSGSRQAAEAQMKKYTDEIYKAGTSSEILDASGKLINAIINGEGEFEKLTAEQREAMADNVEKMAASEISQREKTAGRIKAIADEQLKNGAREEDVINNIIKTQKISRAEAEKIVNTTKSEIVEQKKKTSEMEEQVKKQERLGTLASQALSDAQKGYSTATDEAATYYLQLQKLKKGTEEYKAVNELYQQSLADAKGYDKTKDNITAVQDRINKMFNSEAGKPWLEQMEKIIGVTENKLQFDKKIYENDVKRKALIEGRALNEEENLLIAQKDLDTQKLISAEWIKQLQDRGKLVEDKTAEFGFTFKNVSEADKAKIMDTLRQQKLEIENSELSKLEMNVNGKKILADLQKEFERNQLEFDIEIGLKNKSDLIKALEDDLLEVQSKIKATAGVESKESIELNNQLLELQRELTELRREEYDKRLADLEKAGDKEIQALDKKHEAEAERVRKFNERYLQGSTNNIADKREKENDKLTQQEKDKLEELEEMNKNSLISAEYYEESKLKITEDYKNKREESEERFRKMQLVASETASGIEMELQRKHAEESYTQESALIKKKMDLIKSQSKGFDAEGKPIFSNLLDKENYEALEKQLGEAEKLLSEKGTDLGILGTGLTEAVNNSLTDLFSGDTEAIAENWREFLAQMAGMLQAKLSGFILDMVLSPGTLKYLSALPFPFNVAAVPVIHTAVSSAVKAISDPLLNSVLSFATGGRIDQPTMAIIGDGAKLGGRNREWIFNDEQLRSVVAMSSMSSSNAIVREIRALNTTVSKQKMVLDLHGQTLRAMIRQADLSVSNKSI